MSVQPIKYFDAVSENRALPDGRGSYEWLYGKVGHCPHCDACTRVVFSKDFSKYFDDDPRYHDPCLDEYYQLRVWTCDCGWWDILREGNTGHDSIDPSFELARIWRHGILKLFDVADPHLPITALRSELRNRSEILHHIHHRTMEDLVAGVFSDFFGKCKATVCGCSGDGGIDVIIVEKEKPIALQIKRRIDPKKAEPVSLIREFLTAMQLSNFAVGLYVTTADKFSRSATQTAKLAVDKGLVQSIELINKARFLAILDETTHSAAEPWRHFVDELLK